MLVADRYRLEAAIGRGGMGEVWRATDEVLGRPVAVKLLLGGDADEQAVARFRLEAQTAARLNHPHVVTVFDFGAWNGRLYLVMELVDGVSLAQELAAHGTFGYERVAGIAAQAAAGLAAAHRQNVVHRDIKPGNLMQNADGTVKIADFGIARFVDDPSAALTSTGQIVGTSLYLAPERALGRAAGPGSDIYALGCVLYQLLVGEPPFTADSLTAVLHMHVDAAPAPPTLRRPELPEAFGGYLLRMLAKQPEERPGAQEVADWFAGPHWRGGPRRSAPAPGGATVYAMPRAAARAAASGSGSRRRAAPTRQHSRGQAPPPAQPSSPPSHVQPRARARAQAHPGLWPVVRAHLRRHKTLTTVVAGTTAFVVTALLGMAVFSPSADAGGTQQPDSAPSQAATQAPGAPGLGLQSPATPAGLTHGRGHKHGG